VGDSDVVHARDGRIDHGQRSKQAKGAVKEAVGKVTGDAKLNAEGKADKVEGKIQNAAGGMKDAIRKQND
jgi:uncharacterized protein YjbJ (UPF0337 family)